MRSSKWNLKFAHPPHSNENPQILLYSNQKQTQKKPKTDSCSLADNDIYHQ